MTREVESNPIHQKAQHSNSDGPGRCNCGREKIAIGINPCGGVFFVCPTEEYEREFDKRFMLM